MKTIVLESLFNKETPTQVFPVNIEKFLWTAFFYRAPLVTASEKYEYIIYMLDLLRDCYNWFLLSLTDKHLN